MNEVERLSSKLFDLSSLTPVDKNQAQLHLPPSYTTYKPESAKQLEKLYPEIRFDESKFANEMLLLLTGEVPSVVMPWLMNGDNLENAIFDLFCVHAMTQDSIGLGPNVKKLSVLSVFGDWRQDLPSKKALPKELNDDELAEAMASVKSQSSWSLAAATLMKHTAGVDNLVTIDGHSYIASQQFEQEGIRVVNLTTAKLIVEAIRNKSLLKNGLTNIVFGVDFGNLALAHKLSQEEDFELGILRKYRIPTGNGSTSVTKHELVYGDPRGKRVILIDDLISSGGTILNTVKLLLAQGAKEIIVCASHAVFAGREYYEQLQQVLKYKQVKQILVTDTLPLKRLTRGGDKDLPYIQVTRGGVKENKQVSMLSVDDFIAYTVGLMLTTPNMDTFAKQMGEHVLPQPDPYELYHQITGQKIAKPVITHIYREGQYEKIIKA